MAFYNNKTNVNHGLYNNNYYIGYFYQNKRKGLWLREVKR
jgi:hypothetical protein